MTVYKATYGIFKIGAILVPLNPAFNTSQVTSALNHLSASHLIISTEANLSRKPPRSNLSLLQHLVPDLDSRTLSSPPVPSLKSLILVDNSSNPDSARSFKATTPYDTLVHSYTFSEPLPPQSLQNTDIINIQFTSGTTSLPKAASLTHRSILNNGFSIGARMLLTPSDIICCPPPLFHCFGSVLGYMASATHGSCIAFPSEAFSPLSTLRTVVEEKCTALYGVPTMFLAELDLLNSDTSPISKHEKENGFRHLRTGIAAGSSVPQELMRKLHAQLGLTELTICYGMTETSPVSAMTTTDDPMDKRVGSVGRLLPHVECKIVDVTDRSKILPVGQSGELAVSGYLVMSGYWGDEAKTKEVLVDDEEGKRWMFTGDLAHLSPSGYVTITGRLKDLIIRGGENIHPLEIENCLLAHPAISDVSVVGLPDPKYGEVVAAFVIRSPSSASSASSDSECKKGGAIETEEEEEEEEVRTWVRQRLSGFLVPRHVFFMEDGEGFPKTASGKVQKFLLREEGIRRIRDAAAGGGKEVVR